MQEEQPEYRLLREIVLGKGTAHQPTHADRRVIKVARGLWKHWWPTQEPQDAEDYAKWWKIAFADAQAAIDALDEPDKNTQQGNKCGCPACEPIERN